jgi:hypothetical protein
MDAARHALGAATQRSDLRAVIVRIVRPDSQRKLSFSHTQILGGLGWAPRVARCGNGSVFICRALNISFGDLQ